MTYISRPPLDPKKRLTKELRAVGLPKEALDVLPEWWEDAVESAFGMHEIRGFVAKHFGLEIGPDGLLRRGVLPQACFKTRNGTEIDKIANARSFAAAVASSVAAAVKPELRWSGFPSANVLRQAALDTGRPWIDLSDLLDICWRHGAPVVFLPALPVNSPKMDGMVVYCGERPVILVTTKRAEVPAVMQFILAHEMGHLACDHIARGSALVDEKVSVEGEVDDEQEKDANRYAVDLLSGGINIRLPRLIRAEELARAANEYGARNQIEPGHVVMNAVKNTQVGDKAPWALGIKALSCLPDRTSPVICCRDAIRANIDTDALSDDSYEFLERLGVI